MWLTHMLTDLHVLVYSPAKLFCDNKLAMHIATNSVFHEHTKYVEINCHATRDQVKNSFLKVVHVSTSNQLAVILIKPLHPGPVHSVLDHMSVSNLF